jgi:hypothetical protein
MKKIIPAFIVILCCLACNQKGDILLRLHYEKGDDTDIKYRNYIITGSENDEPVKNEYVRLGLTVDSVIHDSLYALSARIDYVREKDAGFMANEEYSSDKDEVDMSAREKQIDRIVRPVIDSVYHFVINNRGQLIKPLSYANGEKATTATVLFDYESYQIEFPKAAMSTGDEWTNERRAPGTGYKQVSHYYIENVFDSTVQIKVSGTREVSQGVNTDFSGRYVIDKKSHKPISAKTEMKGKMMLEGNVTVVMTIESH